MYDYSFQQQEDYSLMDIILGKRNGNRDILVDNRKETRGLVTVQVARQEEKQRQLRIKKIVSLVPIIAIVGYLVLK
tara:strand:+ start:209 stop:436 length:228 start_codon:yes stop_codon:yes gene_type:complete